MLDHGPQLVAIFAPAMLILRSRDRQLNFVHVGKCAGTSIEIALQDLEIDYVDYHCFDADVRLKACLEDVRRQFFLITVRDPVGRFVSSFYWDLYEKRMLNDHDGPDGLWKSIYDTFRTPNELAEAVSSENQDLANLARAAFDKSGLHMHLSLGWYLSAVDVHKLNPSNAHVIRTEHVDEDFGKFIRKFRGRRSYGPLSREKGDYKNEIEGYSNYLSDQAVRNLREMYREDYLVLGELSKAGLISSQWFSKHCQSA